MFKNGTYRHVKRNFRVVIEDGEFMFTAEVPRTMRLAEVFDETMWEEDDTNKTEENDESVG